ncbi:MAG: TIGR04283 family arsenosugar biosynthesis glycosyltransferase [Pseudomonadota bacterium]
MISVVIPTLNAAKGLPGALTALVPAAADGLVKEVIVVDGGSQDETTAIADGAGARILSAPRGRGGQLAAGAAAARAPWLLFVHADTVLAEGWEAAAQAHLERAEAEGAPRAAVFQFRLDDPNWRARIVEFGALVRCAVLGLPYGDQGLFISRAHYDEIGGFRPLPLMEDVDLVRRIGRRRLTLLRAPARTSAARYRRDGYASRILRNLLCISLFSLGVSPARIARLYER